MEGMPVKPGNSSTPFRLFGKQNKNFDFNRIYTSTSPSAIASSGFRFLGLINNRRDWS